MRTNVLHHSRWSSTNWFFGLVFIMCACAISSFACTCGIPPIKDQIAQTPLIFSGKVTAITPHYVFSTSYPFISDVNKFGDTQSSNIAVTKVWKGKIGSEIAVEKNLACYEDRLEVGKEYLIFAEYEEGKAFIGACTIVVMLAQAKDILPELGAGYPPPIRATHPITTPLLIGSVLFFLLCCGLTLRRSTFLPKP